MRTKPRGRRGGLVPCLPGRLHISAASNIHAVSYLPRLSRFMGKHPFDVEVFLNDPNVGLVEAGSMSRCVRRFAVLADRTASRVLSWQAELHRSDGRA